MANASGPLTATIPDIERPKPVALPLQVDFCFTDIRNLHRELEFEGREKAFVMKTRDVRQPAIETPSELGSGIQQRAEGCRCLSRFAIEEDKNGRKVRS
jgi:hypothetical protein